MDWRQKLAEAKQLVEKCLATVGNADAPGEDKAKVTEWMAEVKKLQAEAAQLKDIEQAALALKGEIEDKQAPPKQAGASGSFPSWESFLEAVWRAQHKNEMVRRVDPRWYGSMSERSRTCPSRSARPAASWSHPSSALSCRE